MRAALAKRRPDLVLPKAAWRKPWVVHCTAWGDGAEAVLRYLARYVFRVAITEGASSGSTTTASPSATSIAHRGAGTQRASAAMSSCAASCNTCCRKGCTRSATQDSGITPGAIMLRAPVSSWRSIGRKPQDRSRGPPSRRYGERLFRSIAVLGAAPLPVLQGRPPRVCAQALPQTGTWTMTRWNERQRLRLRVPVTPRIAAAHTLPFSGSPARIGCDASAITRPNHRARHYRTAAQPRAPRQTAITSLRGHLKNP